MIQQMVQQMFLGLLGLENVPRLQNQSDWLESQLCPPLTCVSVPWGGRDDSPPPGEGVGRMEQGGVLWSMLFHMGQGCAFSSRPGDTEVTRVALALKEATQWGAIHICHPS